MQPHETIETVYTKVAEYMKVEISDMLKQNRISYKRDKLSQEYRNKVAQSRRVAIVILSEIYSTAFVMDIYNFSYSKVKHMFSRYEDFSNFKDNLFIQQTRQLLTKNQTAA